MPGLWTRDRAGSTRYSKLPTRAPEDSVSSDSSAVAGGAADRAALFKRSVRYDDAGRALPSDVGDGSDESFFEEHRMAMEHAMDRQDDLLTELHSDLTAVRQVGEAIREEIDVQDAMLRDLEADMTQAERAMRAVTRQTDRMIKEAGGCATFCIIVVLLIILFVLTLLVLFT
eukprot:PLAT7899.2.p1 GENE.PLAT7899.2~~PLAT7899.2.p1  ORF type:complete len:172 (+),score=20.22 PLAT7899.2:42-557(+)